MYTNYFFIPTSKYKYIKKSEEIKCIDNRIFDFEDSILDSEMSNSIDLLSNVIKRENDWIRLNIREYDFFVKLFTKCLDLGYQNFVIPKFEGIDELESYIDPIIKLNNNARFILLIENAKALIDLESIFKKYITNIHSVSLGIHDFYSELGMLHDESTIRYLHLNLVILAKAYDVEPIDVVSMNISNEHFLKQEILDGFKLGYRSKFLIHPFQLDVLKAVEFYSYDEILQNIRLLEYYSEEVKGKNAVFSYKGKVYEKMHIKNLEKITKWGEKFYGIR